MDELSKQDSYIKLFRKARKNPIFKKPLTFHFFTYCILSAWWNDEPTTFNLSGVDVSIRKGEFATTLRRSAYETGLSIQNIRTAIKVLKATDCLTEDLTRGLTNGGRVLKVCNYSLYQGKKEEGNKPSNRRSNKPSNKQIKKVINKESIKKPPYIPPRGNLKYKHRSKLQNAGTFRQLVKGYLNLKLGDTTYDERINEKYKLNRTTQEAKEELEREGRDKGGTTVGRSEVKDSQIIQNADNRNSRRQGRVQNKQRKGST